MKKLVEIFGVIVVFGLLSGCWGSAPTPDPEPEAIELKTGEMAAVETPELELLETAKRLYAAGLYTVARENFEALRDGYPLSQYAEFAEIKIADSFFEGREYEPAAIAYEEFTKSHPASNSLPYVMMRAGRSHQLAFRGLGRDTQPLTKAVQIYDQTIARYPDTVYSDSAVNYKTEALELIAESERNIAKFYRRKDKEAAVAAREKYIATEWEPLIEKAEIEQTRVAQAAEQARTDNIDSPGADVNVDVSSQRYAALGVPDAYMAMISADQQDSAAVIPGESGSAGDSGSANAEPGAITARWRIESIRCSNEGSKIVFIGLNAPITDSEFLQNYRQFKVDSGPLTLRLPDTGAIPFASDCFRARDVKVSADGVIDLLLSQGTTGRMVSLANPPRLALLIDN